MFTVKGQLFTKDAHDKRNKQKNGNGITQKHDVKAMEFSSIKTGENVCAFVKVFKVRAASDRIIQDKKEHFEKLQ